MRIGRKKKERCNKVKHSKTSKLRYFVERVIKKKKEKEVCIGSKLV
jgi:hypothetical protein